MDHPRPSRRRCGETSSVERATTRGRELPALLQERHGYVRGVDLLVVEDPAGEHDENAWRRRLGPALEFVLGP